MTPYHDMPDAQIMLMVCNANHEAFAVLVQRHTQKYFSLAFRSLQSKGDAEDVVQDAFIKLWQKPNSWNSDKSLFTTWFYRVVLNACHDHLRRKKRWFQVEPQLIESALPPIMSEQSILEEEQEARLQQHYLELGLAKLSAAQRDAINLVVYCELPQKQAASIMGLSLKALESLLVRAKRGLLENVVQLQAADEQRTPTAQTTRINDANSKSWLANF